jgi:hypothetical protein
MQIAPPGVQHRHIGCRHCDITAAHDFNKTELNILDTEMLPRLLIEMLERFCSKATLVRTSVDAEIFASANDRDFERGLDLLDVFIERAAQIGEALIIDGRE